MIINAFSRSNYGAEYQYIFAEQEYDDSSCHHCVHFFVRTVNIIEKKESKFKSHCLRRLNWGFNHGNVKKEDFKSI